MRINPKKTILNLKHFNLKGDVLDVSLDEVSVIYRLLKTKDKTFISIDDDPEYKFDSAAIFFFLSSLNKIDSKLLINDIYKSLKDDGEIYIWDRVKKKNEVIREFIKVKISDDIESEFKLTNLNIFYEFNLERIEKILNKKFSIEEKIIWDNIICIRAKKVTEKANEIEKNSIDSEVLVLS